jgi:hypothetical protein
MHIFSNPIQGNGKMTQGIRFRGQIPKKSLSWSSIFRLFFHFLKQKGGPYQKKLKKFFLSKMTIDTPTESPSRVYSKYVVTKNIHSGIWPKNPKNFTKIRLFLFIFTRYVHGRHLSW